MDLNIFKKKEEKKEKEKAKSEDKEYKPIVLVVLDGWGVNTSIEGNAIANAKKPTIDHLKGNYPCIALQASGISVGLTWGEPGNSEVGHMTMGTGMILYQNLPRINLAIQNGTFFTNPVFQKAIDHCKKNNSALHLMGLVSNGGVHSHIDHLFALMEVAAKGGIKKVFIHAITDGRDTPPEASERFIKMIENKTEELRIGKIASIGGRNWAMDRNKNWDRIEKGYNAITGTSQSITNDCHELIKKAYSAGTSDEFIEPATVVDEKNKPIGAVEENDSIIFFNFRDDRARQITKAFTDTNFKGFKRKKKLKNLFFVSMVEYEEGLKATPAFPPQEITNSLPNSLSKNKKRQLHLAETEKYAHVTYFFNGGEEKALPGEDRTLIPSPQVPSYEATPEMSAPIITDKAIEVVKSQEYDFILINYANADMLGHTGNLKATTDAVEVVDTCLERLIKTVLKSNGALLITADHGNAESMLDPKTGEIVTEHSNNPVPCWLVTPDNSKERTEEEITRHQRVVDGMLVDIPPTILDLMKLPVPTEMVGNSLLPILKD